MLLEALWEHFGIPSETLQNIFDAFWKHGVRPATGHFTEVPKWPVTWLSEVPLLVLTTAL